MVYDTVDYQQVFGYSPDSYMGENMLAIYILISYVLFLWWLFNFYYSTKCKVIQFQRFHVISEEIRLPNVTSASEQEKHKLYQDEVARYRDLKQPFGLNLGIRLENPLKLYAPPNRRFMISRLFCSSKIHGIDISHADIKHLIIDATDADEYLFVGCNISNVLINGSQYPSITFILCNIDNLVLTSTCCNELKIYSSHINNIDCPNPENNPPILKTLHIDELTDICSNATFAKSKQQDIRHLAENSKKVSGVITHKILHIAELKADRKYTLLPNKIISYCYEALSNFGLSPQRSFYWIISISLFTAGLLFFSDGTIMVAGCDTHTWKDSLCDDSSSSSLLRSITISAQHSINPLNIFSKSHFIGVKSIGVNVWLTFQSIFSLLNLALMILAIRLRFKIH